MPVLCMPRYLTVVEIQGIFIIMYRFLPYCLQKYIAQIPLILSMTFRLPALAQASIIFGKRISFVYPEFQHRLYSFNDDRISKFVGLIKLCNQLVTACLISQRRQNCRHLPYAAWLPKYKSLRHCLLKVLRQRQALTDKTTHNHRSATAASSSGSIRKQHCQCLNLFGFCENYQPL